MYLQQIRLQHYRNYTDTILQFCPHLNCLAGNNGEGKTNLLDAIYYLSAGKSYFSATDAQNIQHHADFFRIDGTFFPNLASDTPTLVTIKFGQQRKKEVLCNQQPHARLSDHIGLFPALIIAPDDIQLVKEGSDERRKALDVALSQLHKPYLENLIQYNRLLQQRNALLKQNADAPNPHTPNLLDAYDAQLAPLGDLLHRARQRAVQQLQPNLQQYYHLLSQGNEQVTCQYESLLNRYGFDHILRDRRRQDMQYQRTTQGVHRDDLLFNLAEHPLKKYGSQGQQKSCLIAFKLALFALLKQHKPEATPLLLLDDIFDKLDPNRMQALLRIVASPDFGQVFLSDTQPERMLQLLQLSGSPFSLFEVKQGNAQAISQ